MTDDQILERARAIIRQRHLRARSLTFDQPARAKAVVQEYMAPHRSEVFACAFLDTRNRLIEFREMFYGTIDGASVYTREIVRACLETNAAALILAHNHPSGVAEPSRADRTITRRIQESVSLIDVRLLDHFVVGATTTSFAEQGWL